MKRVSPAKAAAFTAALFVLGWLCVEACGYGLFFLKHRMTPARFAATRIDTPVHHMMTDHPYLPYLAKPGTYGALTFNSLGDRGPEPETPKRRKRVVCFGGSTTFDGSHPIEGTWPGLLQKKLGSGYEVINAAQNGATSADTLVSFALLHWDLAPDFVLAMDGVNDLESSYFPGFRPDYAHRRRKIPDVRYPALDRAPRAFNYSAVWVLLRWTLQGPSADLHDLYSRPGSYDYEHGPFGLPTFERNLRELAALSRERGAKLVVGTPQFYSPWALAHFGDAFEEAFKRGLDAENEIVRALPKSERGVFVAEVARSFAPTEKEMTDFCHLTEAGNEKVAAAYFAAIKKAEARP